MSTRSKDAPSEPNAAKDRRFRPFPDGLIVLFALGCAAVSGYVLKHRSEYLWSTGGIVVCLLVPALSALGLGLSLKASREVRAQVIALSVSVVVALYAFEIYVTIQLSNGAAAATHSGEAPPETRFEAVARFRREGKDAQPLSTGVTVYTLQASGMPEADLKVGDKPFLPLGGVSNVPVVACNEAGPWLVFDSDRLGFRNASAVWDEPSLDIAAVGDSFTEGLCVGDGDSIVGTIRKRVPSTLNLGMGGFGPLLELATIKEYLVSRKPKVVLWFFFENDFENLTREMNQPILRRYLEEPNFQQGLEGMQPAIDAGQRAIAEAAMRAQSDAEAAPPALVEVSLGGFAAMTQLRDRLNLAYKRPEMTRELAALGRVMTEAKRVVDGWNGKLLFVLLPDWKTIQAREGYAPKEGIVKILNERSIPYLDAYDVLAAEPDVDSLFPIKRQAMRLVAPGHYNEKGHGLVGDAVLDWMEKTGALPPKTGH